MGIGKFPISTVRWVAIESFPTVSGAADKMQVFRRQLSDAGRDRILGHASILEDPGTGEDGFFWNELHLSPPAQSLLEPCAQSVPGRIH